MRKWLATLSLSTLALMTTTLANAEVMIAPTRVVFEDGARSAELVIVNKGSEQAAFRISLEDRRMNLDGSMELVTAPLAEEKFAGDVVRYSPRRVIMDPGGRQTIRVSAQTTNLEPGEYRSHLRLMSAPTSAGRTLQNITGGGSDGISIELIAIRSLTIPVIVRVGELDATISIDDAELREVSHTEGSTSLEINLERSGSKSTYGNLEIYAEGLEEPVYYAKGIAVYTPNTSRTVKLPLPSDVLEKVSGQQVRIIYRSANVADPKILAEQTLVLD